MDRLIIGAAYVLGVVSLACVWTVFMVSAKLSAEAWTATGAVATFAAAGVALWVGTAEARRRKDDEERAAFIYRWLFGAEIAALRATLEAIREVVIDIQDTRDGDVLMNETLEYMETLTTELAMPTLGAHLDKLPALPPNFGRPLAALYGHTPGLTRSVRALAHGVTLDDRKRTLATSVRRRIARMEKALDAIVWPVKRDDNGGF